MFHKRNILGNGINSKSMTAYPQPIPKLTVIYIAFQGNFQGNVLLFGEVHSSFALETLFGKPRSPPSHLFLSSLDLRFGGSLSLSISHITQEPIWWPNATSKWSTFLCPKECKAAAELSNGYTGFEILTLCQSWEIWEVLVKLVYLLITSLGRWLKHCLLLPHLGWLEPTVTDHRTVWGRTSWASRMTGHIWAFFHKDY